MCTCITVLAIVLMECLSDIDQWNKVCQVLGTPPREFFKQLQPSVSLLCVCVYLLRVYIRHPSVLFLYVPFYFQHEVYTCMYTSICSCGLHILIYMYST